MPKCDYDGDDDEEEEKEEANWHGLWLFLSGSFCPHQVPLTMDFFCGNDDDEEEMDEHS